MNTCIPYVRKQSGLEFTVHESGVTLLNIKGRVGYILKAVYEAKKIKRALTTLVYVEKPV